MAKQKRKKKSVKWSAIMTLIGLLLIGTGSWALYSLINMGAGDLLAQIGIQNAYAQLGIVVVVVIVGLLLGGVGIGKSIRTLVKG
jgi:hypothetical protein